ncbi:MAG: phage major tail tube protein [Ruminococcus sp.]|nr:phage major tail tube protein [Ruminococcus sp.]
MEKTIDIRGPVNADTTYVDGQLVARNTTVTLPEVTHVTATIQTALGEHELPLYGLVDSMESTIKKIGTDEGLAKMLMMQQNTFEHRWVQQVTKADGSSSVEGCKAFIRGIPKIAVPSFEVNPGDSIEVDVPLSVTRYQLFIGGKEICLIDKLAGICRINGEDYAEKVNSLL